MSKRILIGGLVAGTAMFIWGALSHMVLGLGDAGIKPLPAEGQVLAALQANIKATGFYFFPALEDSPEMTKEQRTAAEKRWNEKYLEGPRGVLIYHPDGAQAISPRKLLSQLLSEILTALIVAFVLSRTALSSFAARIGLVALLGLLPFLVVNFPYWNWYGFPTTFTLTELADRLIAFLVAGLVLAAIIRTPSTTTATASAEMQARSAP